MMETKTRGPWIAAAVAVILLTCACLVLFTAVLGVGWLNSDIAQALDWTASEHENAVVQRTFAVGQTPHVRIESFAGRVNVRPGESGQVHVAATKKALRGEDLRHVKVEASQRDNEVIITARQCCGGRNSSVNLDITVPANTYVDLSTGAGDIDIRGLSRGARVDAGAGRMLFIDVTGPLEVRSGAMSIEVHGAQGPAELRTGTGSISYEGKPEGDSAFHAGAGDITLLLPEDLDAQVDIGVSAGLVDVDYSVHGRVKHREVQGTIGEGYGCSIRAGAGAGRVVMRPR